ncbi:MAG: biosynthetic-type acetolactate synthase large subunit [Acidimicrobiales bacterium]
MELTGAQALVKSLEMEGVEVIFGLPGGAILPVYDPIISSPIRHVLVRHEQGAGHMAEGYAHVTGRPGVAMVTSGPGATNIVTPLCDAYMDSVPLVCVTGQVPYGSIGTDAFQEADTTGITMGVTKHNWLVTDASDIPRTVAEAFHVATTGRPGPVLIDVPKDVSLSSMEWYWPASVDLPGYRGALEPDPEAVEAAAALLAAARRPVLYVGGGVIRSGASAALRDLVDLCGAPVVTTLMARGALADSDPLCLGMPGMHGNYTAVRAMQEADLLVALGARFDDRVTGKVSAFAPRARVVHVDVDKAEIGKVRRPDVAIVADCRRAVEALVGALRRAAAPEAAAPDAGASSQERLSGWIEQLRDWQERYPLTYDVEPAGSLRSEPDPAAARPPHLKPQQVIETLCDATPDDTILCSGVGQHQMWASQYWRFEHPNHWVSSGGLGTMGFAVPAAIGAKVGRPDKMVWAVDGDGCFQMTAQELVTASAESIPVKIAILNNAYLGMVRQWQHMFYEERYSEVYLSPDLPDYVLWAEAMGCVGLRVTEPEEVLPAIEKANEVDDRPVVIDFRTDPMEQVFPMVPAGASNDDIVVHPSQRGSS